MTLCWLLLGAAALSQTSDALVGEVRLLMGTTAEVRVGGLGDAPAALDAAFAALRRVDDSMSLWKPTELTTLNASGQGAVSAELMTVLRGALEISSASGGAYDPTVEPLVRARGHLGGDRRSLSDVERRRLVRHVGWQRVHLDSARGVVQLDPGTRLDLGGIAKGHAVECAVEALRHAGGHSGFVDLGQSSVGVFGTRLTLDVSDPQNPEHAPWASFELSAGFVGTSGPARRGTHILDPRSGRSAHGVLGATVVSRRGAEADALATALFVLGQPGLGLVRRRGAHGLVLLREHGQRVIVTTRGFVDTYRLRPTPAVRVREQR